MIPLYTLLESLKSDPNAPNIVLQVTLADLRQLMVDTIDATRERLLPIFIKAKEDRLISKDEVCEKLGIGQTQVWKLTKKGVLHAVKVGRSCRYRLSEVNDYLESKS